MDEKIFKHENPEENAFLRQRTREFVFSEKGNPIFEGKEFSRGEFAKLVAQMRKVMKKTNGIGLSANQIGLPYRMFIGQVPVSKNNDGKLYVVLNPSIEKDGGEKEISEEGCLSVSNKYGEVERSYSVVLRGFDRYGKPMKVKAWGLLARMFQHEMDHLNGKLFIDRAKKTIEVNIPSKDV